MPQNPPMPSRASRRMSAGLLENAPKPEAKVEPMVGPRQGRMRPVGEKATDSSQFTKAPEPVTAKSNPSMATGSRSQIIGRAKSIAAKEGMLKRGAANATKGAATIAAIEAAGPIMGAASALAAADEATGYKRTQYSGNFGGPSFQTNPYASGKPAYAGQSVVSKLMGVGKKGK